MRVLALVLLLAPGAAAQEFKRPVHVPRERYVVGVPVAKIKPGSRFDALRLVPSGWECYVVAAAGKQVHQVPELDTPDAETHRKAGDCTDVHNALSPKSGTPSLDLTVIVRRPGSTPIHLIRVTFAAWDAGLSYHVKAWPHDPRKIFFPMANAGVGAEPFRQKIRYSENERLLEVADFERARRDKDAVKKNPKKALKDLEMFRTIQRRIKLDRGLKAEDAEDRAYVDAQSARKADLLQVAGECQGRGEFLEAFRAAASARAIRTATTGLPVPDVAPDGLLEGVRKLDPEARERVRVNAAVEATQSMREKKFLEGAEAMVFLKKLGDPAYEKLVAQARRSAFQSKEIAQGDVDEWIELAGPLPPLASPSDVKEGAVFLVDGKVKKAGAFTLVASGPGGAVSWVFEDKAGLRFEEGDEFTLLAVADVARPPDTRPADLKSQPFLRLVVIR